MPEKITKNTALKSQRCRIEIQGRSTLIPFSAIATTGKVSAQISGQRVRTSTFEADVLAGHLCKFVLKLPVITLKSSDATLNKHLHRTLNAAEFPTIQAKVLSYDLKSDPKLVHAHRLFGALVELTIAGVTKTIPAEASVQIHLKSIRISGKKKLFMKDFGITPPIHLLGAVRVSNEIQVLFDLELGL